MPRCRGPCARTTHTIPPLIMAMERFEVEFPAALLVIGRRFGMAAHSGKDRGGNHSYRTILRIMFAKLKYVSAQCMRLHEICIDEHLAPS
jgi:hypothetical protein